MKKIVLNITDVDYEKFRFEAIHEKKGVSEVIRSRLFHKKFHQEVEEAYDAWLEEQLIVIMNDKGDSE